MFKTNEEPIDRFPSRSRVRAPGRGIPSARLICWALLALLAAGSDAQLSPSGELFELSQTRGVIDRPRVALTEDGGFLAVWDFADFEAEGDDRAVRIVGRRFDAQGLPLGDEFVVVEGTPDENSVEQLAATADGAFLVIWSRHTRFGPGLFVRVVAGDGSMLGPEVVLRAPRRDEVVGLEGEHRVALAVSPDGTSVALWDMLFGNQNRIEAQRLSSTGELLGEVFQVNALDVGGYTDPNAAFTPQGDLIAVWVRLNRSPRGTTYTLEARRFSSDGSPLSGDVTVDDLSLVRHKILPQVAGLENGGFVVVWTDHVRNQNILGRQFDRKNRQVGGRLQLNGASGLRQDPRISHQGNSRVIAIWRTLEVGGLSGVDIGARALEPRGRLSGAEINLSPEGASHQYDASVTTTSEARALVVWVDEGADPVRRAVIGRFLEIGPPIAAWPARPAGLRAEAVSATEVRLTWSDNADNEDAFEVEIRGSGAPWRSAATTGADGAEIVVDDLQPGSRYKLRVRAVNAAGASNWSNRSRVALPEP